MNEMSLCHTTKKKNRPEAYIDYVQLSEEDFASTR